MPERPPRLRLEPGQRIGIVAGGGTLPLEVAAGLRRQGIEPFVLIVEGEADPTSGLADFPHRRIALEEAGSFIGILKQNQVSHLVLAGEIRRRPKLLALKPTLGLLTIGARVAAALARGDDGLLKIVVRELERRGIHVVGAHEIVPDLLADEGPLTAKSPRKVDLRDIEAAQRAAEAIGRLDIGQGAVAIAGRAVALEGIEGTDGLLERVRHLRDHGRLAGKQGGVLVKCAKPGQELRADLPSIGPRTVESAHAAGLAGIAVEAGRSLVLEGPETIARADALGLFIVGLPPGGVDHG